MGNDCMELYEFTHGKLCNILFLSQAYNNVNILLLTYGFVKSVNPVGVMYWNINVYER